MRGGRDGGRADERITDLDGLRIDSYIDGGKGSSRDESTCRCQCQ